ncbi:TPA: methyltransferase domain-containing protein [Proteus mirabilis]
MMDNHEDFYTQSAEMYDILSEQHWKTRENTFIESLYLMGINRGNWLNIGAGTGQELAILAQTFPNIHILAIEPSASMRIGLMTRLMMLPKIQHQVTVIADTFQNAILPKSFSAAIICGCIGYFDQNDRRLLWNKLANGLEEKGAILVDTMPFNTPCNISKIQLNSKKIGRHIYEIYLSGKPINEETIRWNMNFKIIEDDKVIRSFNIERDWYTFGIEQVIKEASREGLVHENINSSTVPMTILRHK